MAYANEMYVKCSIIKSIRLLANQLDLSLYFDDPETIAYGDLVELRNNLLNQYNEKMFIAQGLKENGFK